MALSKDPSSEASIQNYRDHGFLIVPDIVSPETLKDLRECASRLASLARAGSYPFVRTWPKQFPPWPSNTPDDPQPIWGVQHLLSPTVPAELRGSFASSYFSVREVVKAILEEEVKQTVTDSELVLELYNMLVDIRPPQQWRLRWHRDDISDNASAEEELRRLAEPSFHAQWNLALYDDDSLVVVPGSHRRARTDAERSADPYAKELPEQKVVQLKAGSACFYDNNILHTGQYAENKERMTLHGSMGHSEGSRARSRNVLQHGMGDWVENCTFEELNPELKGIAIQMRDRLIALSKVSGDVGYFSKDE